MAAAHVDQGHVEVTEERRQVLRSPRLTQALSDALDDHGLAACPGNEKLGLVLIALQLHSHGLWMSRRSAHASSMRGACQ